MKNKISRRAVLMSGAATLLAGNAKANVTEVSKASTASKETETSETSASIKKLLDNLDHEKFMRLAIEQAHKVPACPFGAVVVNIKTGKVVGEGWVRTEKNPIWHGEMTAIYNCPDSDNGFDWSEVALYTTGESCPMCQSAIIWTKMPLVVYGSSIPFLQTCDFGQIDIRAQTVINASRYGKCAIIGGVLEAECNQLFIKAKALNSKKS